MDNDKLKDWRARLEVALQDASDWYDVERSLRQTVSDAETEDARPFVYAFGYMLLESRRDESRERHGCAFAPRIEWGDGQAFPAPLRDVDEATVELWASWADEIPDPIAASRFHDLLWERRHGERPDLHARAAASAYLDLTESDWDPLYRAFCATRALELAQSIRDDGALLARAIQRCIHIADEELSVDERRPGITLRAIEALADLRVTQRPDVTDLLRRSRERYSQDPWIEQSISDIEASIASKDDRAALYLSQVQRWRQEAARATGILKYAHLQHALELARTHTFNDQVREILQEIQAITPEELDLKQVSVEIELPTDQVDTYIDRLNELDSWRDALTSFGLQGPPTGSVEDIDTRVAELARDHPLLGLIPRQVIGSESSLVWSAAEADEHARADLSEQEALSIRVFSVVAARILNGVAAGHNRPSTDDLAAYFEGGLSDAGTVEQLADGASRFWTEDYRGATHILAPAVEACIRSLAARIGIVVIEQPRGEKPGGVRTLGKLISALEGRMDESWRRYLANALTDQLGVNLRNTIAHGLGGTSSPADAALLIHIACYLRLLSPGTITPPESETT